MLAPEDAAAYVSHQRRHSRAHSLSDLTYDSMLTGCPGGRVREVTDEDGEGIVCVAVALWRDNGVAHLIRMVEDGREEAATAPTHASAVS